MKTASQRESFGLTFAEVLVVLGIILALAGLLLPVYVRSKDSANETVCATNLRQLSAAIQLYASEYDDQVPMTLLPVIKHSQIPHALYQCTSRTPGIKHKVYVYMVVPSENDTRNTKWEQVYRHYKDQSIILVDQNHRSSAMDRGNPFQSHFAIGAQLDGTVRYRIGAADPTTFEFWNQTLNR